MKFGTDEQKKRYLPPMLHSDLIWCQGYSEPGSGSDLASLRTRAVRDGDHYVINGSKTWTTGAHIADWMFCLVRTSTEGKPQDGISFVVFPMSTPGVKVEPIVTADGNRDGNHEVNQVFLDDVRIPVEQRIGEENKGLTCAKYLLEFERGGNCTARARPFERLSAWGRGGQRRGQAGRDPAWRESWRTEIEIRGWDARDGVLSKLSGGQNPARCPR